MFLSCLSMPFFRLILFSSVLFLQGIATAPNGTEFMPMAHLVPMANLPKSHIPKPNYVPKPNIVGGFVAKKGQFPSQISLRSERGPRGHFCGGSILDRTHILTAGHCGDAMSPPYSDFYVAAGANNLNDTNNMIMQVKNVKVHEDFSYYTLENDVAIVELQKKLKYGKYIKPIKLTNKKVKTKSKCTISGWGVWSEGSYTIHYELKGAYVPIVSSKECSKDYSSTPYQIFPKSMVCAGYKNGGTDTCQGDSGGPLIFKKKQVGITSWGKGCAEAGFPGVYTNVHTYVKWIKKHGVKVQIADDDEDVEQEDNEDEDVTEDDETSELIERVKIRNHLLHFLKDNEEE